MLGELVIIWLAFCVYFIIVNYYFEKRTARENGMLKHMLDQISGKVCLRLIPENTTILTSDQEIVQKGLEILRNKFPEGIPNEVQKLFECLMQFGFNAGGPALWFKRTCYYTCVDKEVYYDKFIEISKILDDTKKLREIGNEFRRKALSLNEKIE